MVLRQKQWIQRISSLQVQVGVQQNHNAIHKRRYEQILLGQDQMEEEDSV